MDPWTLSVATVGLCNKEQRLAFRFSLYFDVSSVLSDPGLDSVRLHCHFKNSGPSREFVWSILTKPGLTTICEINRWALVFPVIIIVVIMTTWHPLHSLLLNQWAIDACVNWSARHILIFHSNVVAVIIKPYVLIDWDVNEKKAFAFASICYF
jgi:hypothetical protein